MTYDRIGGAVDEHEAGASSPVAKQDTPQVRPPHHPDCQWGWLGEDLDGRPVPCVQCRPHLARMATLNGQGPHDERRPAMPPLH